MLVEELLTEKLGKLRSLNVGSMINILKQSKHSSRRSADEVTQTGNVFGGNKSAQNFSIGKGSEIIDVGPIKNGIGGLRKAYKEHDSAKAFALYINGKAVAFGKFDQDALGGSSRTGILAYDLTQFKDKIEAATAEKRKNASEWDKNRIRDRKLTSYHEKDGYEYTKDYKRVDTIEKYHGELSSTAELKKFLEELIELADGLPITCKLVLLDTEGNKKRGERYSAKMSKDELFSGLDALRTRLQKYKISKKPTVNSIEEFLETVRAGAVRVVQFGGRGWATKSRDHGEKVSPESVLSGKPFTLSYSCVDPGAYESLNVYYAFDKDTGILSPFKATWSTKDSDGYTRSQSAAIGEPGKFFKHEYDVKLDKDSLIKKVLTYVKDGADRRAKDLMTAARKAGHDYPEFAAIEKSINSANKKKE